MLRAAAILPLRAKLEQINNHLKGLGGVVSAMTPKKQDNPFKEGGALVTKEKIDPIVAFSKPPPLPPVLGPLVLLSLWETWSSRDSNEN